ncbi:phosphatidate cytidylyltransferase [Pedobacter cryophilus]|uniref:Phosphatidate cytidylyltransferase n=1 Tax=Pedobacter cryophilus TaxID=2571271 RepID=A0A4U1C385_9SPHI|nr:phosphatidate cytidylyltransferase [Pedobacter cryophilus]TKB97654.1 phosphatidate cytidylyltransferase [Pedobacter cryophilus]
MNNFIKRTITGIALILVIIPSIYFSVYSFIVLLLTINTLALLEFYGLFSTKEVTSRKFAGLLLSIGLIITTLLVSIDHSQWKILLINIPLAFGIYLTELYHFAKNPFYNLAFTFLGVFYITIPLCFLVAIAFLTDRQGSYQYQIILGYFLMLWTSDSFAYLVGKSFGHLALFKRVSPLKTWEGSAGGFVATLWITYLISLYFTIISPLDWLIMALIVVVTGTYGDFIKSLLKRNLNIKDTGNILPGHGGMLDRFDSLLGSAPFVFSYLLCFKYE